MGFKRRTGRRTVTLMLILAAFLLAAAPPAASQRPATGKNHQKNQGQTSDFAGFEEFEKTSGESASDPLSGYNRVMTQVNDRLYYWVLKPTGQAFRFVLAEPARQSIAGFFKNLGFPQRFVNNLFQLKFKRAGSEVTRFVINTTVGVAGLWDPATKLLDIPAYPEDFGQTLGHYGLAGGFHVVLPLFGPSNLRDACGKVVDWPLDPVHYLEDGEAVLAVTGVETVNKTSLSIGEYEALTQDAMDLYILLKDAYRQNRNKKIKE